MITLGVLGCWVSSRPSQTWWTSAEARSSAPVREERSSLLAPSPQLLFHQPLRRSTRRSTRRPSGRSPAWRGRWPRTRPSRSSCRSTSGSWSRPTTTWRGPRGQTGPRGRRAGRNAPLTLVFAAGPPSCPWRTLSRG